MQLEGSMKDTPINYLLQTSGLEQYVGHVNKGPQYLIEYFRDNPLKAKLILGQSNDKRYTPSTFIEEQNTGYRVGWYDTDRTFTRKHNQLEEAVTDYLLFSFGKGRYES
jgi:hypothetical protein